MLELEVTEELKSEWVLPKAGNYKIGLHKIGQQYFRESKGAFYVERNAKIVFEIGENIRKVGSMAFFKKQ